MTATDSLELLFELQLTLQRQLYAGMHPGDFSPAQRAEYIRTQVIALNAELFEALDEIAWKPWASTSLKFNRDPFIRELVDALHFLFNMFLAAGATPHEIAAVYADKHRVNMRRHEKPGESYDATTGKCPCGRSLDDYPAETQVSAQGIVYHSADCTAFMSALGVKTETGEAA